MVCFSKQIFKCFLKYFAVVEALGGSEATWPCRNRRAVAEELFPTAPGLCAGFALTPWQTLFSTPWEKCQCSVNFQPFYYLETQDENAVVILFKLKLFQHSGSRI